ncbi:class I fructose-bisphosphate aldolase [uncultured Algimonas sp.]|uniref:class I fructose-bisphosphate aldolase n=1 Tax=uncultured Algimonas sp. TaxID=1547920 RepID=UPI002610C7E6|nr:class I fructose-bisphosphate aldolase [uncultured Algimonas sp.]
MERLDEMKKVAQAMVAPGKGILAADESTGTIGKRLASIDTENTEGNRRAWREMLFRTDEAMRERVSGVILYDETLRQSASDGTPLVDLIRDAGAVPGIKVDKGAKPMALHPGETITEGLDGLRERLAEYHDLGARFAKWRAVITIAHPDADHQTPTRGAVLANAESLARYAALCQEAGIVPIVEPEVLMDGCHTIDRCEAVTRDVLVAVFDALRRHNVRMEAMVLKPNMIVSAADCDDRADVQTVAARTLSVLKDIVPSSVPGIAFLSGGQDDVTATAHLDAMNRRGDLPWSLTYSYGRALQQSTLRTWSGKAENVPAAQEEFSRRCRMNGLASTGEWSQEMEAGA